MPKTTVWLSDRVVADITGDARAAAPNETGGMLLGWENADRHEFVVLDYVCAGPGAVHTPTSFRPDAEWQQSRLDAAYQHSNGIVSFLGDWHVHPDGGYGSVRFSV